MAADAGIFDLVLKYVLMPLLGILVGIISWTAKKLDSRVKDLEDTSSEIEKRLLKDYYDREEIRETIYEPLSSDIKETRSELKALAGMVSDIHSDMAILKFKILGESLDNQNR